MQKFSLLENFKHTNDQIEDYFIEYVDNKKFDIEEGFISKDGRFFTGIGGIDSKTKQAKHLTIRLDDVANGITTYSNGKCLSEFDTLVNAMSIVKTFFIRTGYPVNYQILPSYDDITIHIYVIGGLVEDNHLNTKSDIDNKLSELQVILKEYGYKRVTLKNSNWLEIRTPVKDRNADYYLNRLIRQALDGNLNVEGNLGERRTKFWTSLNEWCQKITPNYSVNLSGGDNQVVIRLKKLP